MASNAAVDSAGGAEPASSYTKSPGVFQPAGGAADSAGASQPARAMQPLGALNKSSGRVSTSHVRFARARTDEYTYNNKRDGREVQAHKFEVWLVGRDPQHYCVGYAKGNTKTCLEAKGEYADGTVWALPHAAFNTCTQSTFISTPIPFRVDLAKSTLTQLDG